jgi:hypothetical protein
MRQRITAAGDRDRPAVTRPWRKSGHVVRSRASNRRSRQILRERSSGYRAIVHSASYTRVARPGGEAARFASHRYEEMTRFRVPSLIAFGLFFVLAALAAMVSSPWPSLSAGFFALMLAFQVLWPRRLRRRVERLQAEGGG